MLCSPDEPFLDALVPDERVHRPPESLPDGRHGRPALRAGRPHLSISGNRASISEAMTSLGGGLSALSTASAMTLHLRHSPFASATAHTTCSLHRRLSPIAL